MYYMAKLIEKMYYSECYVLETADYLLHKIEIFFYVWYSHFEFKKKKHSFDFQKLNKEHSKYFSTDIV